MGPQTPIGDEKEANKGPTWVQKGVRKGSKSKTLEKLKIELPLQRELNSQDFRVVPTCTKKVTQTGPKTEAKTV